MEQVKIFSGQIRLNYESNLDERINDWLTENPNIKITRVCQSHHAVSVDVGTLVVSIWYQPATEGGKD